MCANRDSIFCNFLTLPQHAIHLFFIFACYTKTIKKQGTRKAQRNAVVPPFKLLSSSLQGPGLLLAGVFLLPKTESKARMKHSGEFTCISMLCPILVVDVAKEGTGI